MSRQLSMSKNAIAKRAWREKQAQLKAQGTVGQSGAADTTTATVADAAAPVEVDSTLTVSVAVPAKSERPLSLKERLFGKKQVNPQQPAVKKTPAKGSGKKKEIKLVSGTLPAIIAGLIATYIRNLLPKEYQPCAPSKEEASAVLGPLFEILGRQVEFTGKATETTIDLTNAFLAGIGYGARAYTTYIDIKHDLKREKERHEQQQSGHNGVASSPTQQPTRLDDYRGGNHPAASHGAGGTDAGGHEGSAGHADTAAGDVGIGGAADSDGDLSDRDREADAVSRLFRRDIAGRKQIGLLPATVS